MPATPAWGPVGSRSVADSSFYQPRECSMLVLTRKYQEKIRIGENITITVLRTKGKAVRLGIEAPADVPVIRGELSFDHESKEAAEPAGTVSFNETAPSKQLVSAGGMATATRWASSHDSEPKVTLS